VLIGPGAKVQQGGHVTGDINEGEHLIH
jgi:hypothetical protein